MANPTRTLPKFTIYRGFPPTPNHVWSPFVNKLEARFRLAGLPYRIDAGTPRQAPRGKIPYIRIERSDSDSDSNDELLGDSTLIARTLVSAGLLPDLNAALTPAERGRDLAVRALLEDRLYFYGVRERWVDNYAAMRDGALAALPWPVRLVVGNLAYRGAVAALHGQGAGRYSAEEARDMRREAWEALEALLAEERAAASPARDGPFWVLAREEPTEADTALYGFITAALVCTA